MSGSIRQGLLGVRRDLSEQTTRRKVRQALLACGVLYAVLYPVANDAIAATLYPGYSRLSQAVSELSATGAPSKPFLTAAGPLFTLLQVGFGIGMWQSAHGRRAVRIAGALMVAHGVMSALWVFAPMSRREVIAAGGATSADTRHLVLAAGTGLFIVAYVAASSVAFGWWFRAYSVVTLATALVFGRLSAQVGTLEAGKPTPYMGLLERVGIGAWLLWLVVAAVALLHRDATTSPWQHEAASPGSQRPSHQPVPGLVRPRGMEHRTQHRVASLVVALATTLATVVTTGTGPAGAATTPASLAQAAFARMTEPQRIGQLFMVGTPATGLSTAAASDIYSYHVGNLILTGRSYAGPAPVRYLTASADRRTTSTATAGVPLLVATDQEGGAVQVLQGNGFTRIPTALTQSTWADTTLTASAASWGRQLTRAGVDLNLAPVMDTVPATLGTGNPPIGYWYREYGHTPAVVAAKGSDVVRGERSVGLAVTAKHFPGLGHVTANTDTTADVTDTVTTRTSADIAAFRAATAAGAPVVMVSLAVYSRIDAARPAAFSPTVITGMIRGDLGFTGVVMSDDLGNARQVAAWSPGTRAVAFIYAGGDVVLTVNPAVLPAMVGAVSARATTDPVFRAKVDAAAYRVLLTKAGYGLLSPRLATDGALGPLTVSAVQRWLGLTATGSLGSTTIRALQARVGTTADGLWGPASMAALQSYLGITRDGATTWNSRTVNDLQAYLNTQL